MSQADKMKVSDNSLLSAFVVRPSLKPFDCSLSFSAIVSQKVVLSWQCKRSFCEFPLNCFVSIGFRLLQLFMPFLSSFRC